MKKLILLISICAIAAAQAQYTPPTDVGGGGGLTAASNLSDVANAGTSRTNLGLAIGTNVQAFDADLTTWAGVTPGTGIAAALAINTGSAGAPVLFNGVGGTPSSLTGTNISGTAASLTAGNVTTVAAATTHASDLTATPLNLGGWTEYFVTSSDFTTTSLTLVDITGLVSGTLSNSTKYEFETVLLLLNAADSTGIKLGVHGGGTGSAATCFANVLANGSSATNCSAASMNAVDTLSSAFTTYSGGQGIVIMKGFFTSMSTGTATISMQAAKVTSNTATIRVGSVLRIRKAHP